MADNLRIMDDQPAALPCEGKLAFDTRAQAQAAATVARHRYGNMLKIYQCRHCGLWHLSSNYDET